MPSDPEVLSNFEYSTVIEEADPQPTDTHPVISQAFGPKPLDVHPNTPDWRHNSLKENAELAQDEDEGFDMSYDHLVGITTYVPTPMTGDNSLGRGADMAQDVINRDDITSPLP